ncbi:hypothetical protein [Streptacidiphilus sp. P02-A3a]|uniref:hypothetical protein n=1 Tax=Streptacidiphilus sp. P02-A3a TaxID=2704468 RepID=UPI0015F92271|nr:hypothetical protein [Streptacidiphilus sp. P02-A3a]QMU69158.1 hypothetical protein GXP74_13770 [Streptacidiphilus sp. P02-A3a]
MADTPRVLRITFQFHVNRKLGRNIAYSKVERAVGMIKNRVLELTPGVFPWAETVRIRTEWLYDWQDDWIEEAMPSNEFNTLPPSDEPEA